MIRIAPAVVALTLLVPAAAIAADREKARYEYDAGDDAKADAPPPRKLEARGVGDDDEARRILRKWDKEPSIRETQIAAVRYAEIDAGRISSWRTRAGISALAPEISGEYRRNIEDDRTLGAQTSGNVDYQSLDDDDRYTARARWELDRLVFNPDELRVSAEATDLVKLREDVLDQVTKLYFERRRLQVELETAPPAEVGTRLKKELRLQELTAAIDGLTGGWFARELKEKGLAP